MNRIIIKMAFFVVGLCLSSPVFAQEIKSVTVNFSESDFVFSYDDNGYLMISSVEHTATYGEDTSQPALPYTSLNLLIGPYQKYKDFTFSIERKTKIKSNVIVAPNSEVYPTDGSVHVNNNSVNVSYGKLKYPDAEVEYAGVYQMDGYRFLGFEISPFVYDAENKDLYLIETLTVSTSLDDDNALRVKRSSRQHGDVMFGIVKKLVKNSDEIETLYSATRQTGKARILGHAGEDIEYLLITNENLAEAFQELRNWKEEKGVTAKILTVEEIKDSYEGETVQLKIKNCLRDYYENYGLRYVLLGGDNTVVPVMGCYGKVETKNGDRIDKSIPTDLFYACFDNNFEWNANGNDIYGEIDDDIDMVPEIFLSRLPVRTIEDVNGYVDKLLGYEQGWTSEYFANNILMCGVNLYNITHVKNGEVVSDGQYCSEAIYSALRLLHKGDVFKFYDTYSDFPGGANYDCNAINFQSQLAKGYSFVDMVSHGSYDAFLLESNSRYCSEDALNLYNNGPTIMTTIACCTNGFDDPLFEPCLSEAFIRNRNSGVIAYLGCSREGWATEGGTGKSVQYEKNFYRTLFKDSNGSRVYAEVVANAKLGFINRSKTGGSSRWIMFGLNPLGDPEMPIYTQKPVEFENICFEFNGDSLIIDTGVEGSRICVMSLHLGRDYYSVVKDVKTAIFNNLSDGEIDICVTAPGYIPWRYIGHVKYIQNETISNKVLYSGTDASLIGSDVTETKEHGPVVIKNGGKLEFQRGGNVIIKGYFEVEKGGELIIVPSNE